MSDILYIIYTFYINTYFSIYTYLYYLYPFHFIISAMPCTIFILNSILISSPQRTHILHASMCLPSGNGDDKIYYIPYKFTIYTYMYNIISYIAIYSIHIYMIFPNGVRVTRIIIMIIILLCVIFFYTPQTLLSLFYIWYVLCVHLFIPFYIYNAVIHNIMCLSNALANRRMAIAHTHMYIFIQYIITSNAEKFITVDERKDTAFAHTHTSCLVCIAKSIYLFLIISRGI